MHSDERGMESVDVEGLLLLLLPPLPLLLPVVLLLLARTG